MDTTAVSLCMDNNIPIICFGVDEEDGIKRVISGEDIGTRIIQDRKKEAMSMYVEHEALDTAKEKMDKTISVFKKELSHIRRGVQIRSCWTA